jgi:two-component system, sensor histidine kinase
MNLVANAIKFTSRGGILIGTRRRGNDVLLQIWDTGIGITEESMKHIYDEFYQVGNPQRDRMAGLGLGLAIVKRSMDLLGNEVTCQSRFGRGTVFSLRLPVAASDGLGYIHPESAIGNRAGNKSFLRGKRFVVVEDSVLVANGLMSWLEGNGGEVRHFLNAEEALRDSGMTCMDYYIADYMLSGTLNGIQFFNCLRQKFAGTINAVLITGDTSTAFIKSATACEWPVLYKPIDTSLLLAALRI